MDENKERMHKFVDSFRDTICLDWGLSLVKLLGFTEDDGECYYVVQHPSGKIEWLSEVGWIVPLKGKLDEEYYTYIVNRFEMSEASYLPMY